MSHKFFQLLQDATKGELFKEIHGTTQEEIHNAFLIMDTIKKHGTDEEVHQVNKIFQMCNQRKLQKKNHGK